MTRLVRACAPTLAILTAGALLLAVTGHAHQTAIVGHAALHAIWVVADTIARALGYLALAYLGVLAVLVWRDRNEATR